MSHLPFIVRCHRAPMTKVTSKGKWSLFKKFLLDLGMHISKKQTCLSHNLLDPT
jgi:hypothetical protein